MFAALKLTVSPLVRVWYHGVIVQITALLRKRDIVTKTVPLNLRVTPEFKALLVRLAAGENRTITSYLEWLVKRDARRQRESRKTDAKE